MLARASLNGASMEPMACRSSYSRFPFWYSKLPLAQISAMRSGRAEITLSYIWSWRAFRALLSLALYTHTHVVFGFVVTVWTGTLVVGTS